MSLKSLPISPIPEETARVVHAVFPHGNVFMQLRNTLGVIYNAEAKARSVSYLWSTRFSHVATGTGDGVPIYGGPDGRQEALAVCDRLAWKYALGLQHTWRENDKREP